MTEALSLHVQVSAISFLASSFLQSSVVSEETSLSFTALVKQGDQRFMVQALEPEVLTSCRRESFGLASVSCRSIKSTLHNIIISLPSQRKGISRMLQIK